MNPTLEQLILQIAISQIGVKEATGHNDGSRVEVYERFIGAWAVRQAWCASFASWVMYQAAAKLHLKLKLEKTASSIQFVSEGVRHGLILAHPQPGCIGCLKGGPGGYEHTFIVESVDAAHGLVHSIDGNWANQVMRTHHAISQCTFIKVA